MMESFLEAFDFSKETSLYIHVPFCTSKCSYCAFYSVPCVNRQSQMMAYVDRIVSEIEIVNSKMVHRPYKTAFIGGGNPGCLGPVLLGRIAEAVCSNGRPEEFSTEMNPESLSEDCFPLFGKYFTRMRGHETTVLIGPEGDFSPEEVKWALEQGYEPVSLGAARLRTETAAVVACHTAVLINE